MLSKTIPISVRNDTFYFYNLGEIVVGRHQIVIFVPISKFAATYLYAFSTVYCWFQKFGGYCYLYCRNLSWLGSQGYWGTVHQCWLGRVARVGYFNQFASPNISKLLSPFVAPSLPLPHPLCPQVCSLCLHLHSVQFSCSVVSDSLWPHGLQHTRPPCPPPTPRACSNSCPLSQWCHPTISSSVVPFSSWPHSFPASGAFQMSQLFASGGQYWSFSFNISPSNEYSGLISFRMDWLDLLAVQGTLKSLLQHHNSKASVLWHSVFFIVQLSHPYMTTGKTIALTIRTFVAKVTSLLFNMLSTMVITFLPKSKCLLISWLPSPSAVILEPPKISSVTFPLFPHLFAMKCWDQMPWS